MLLGNDIVDLGEARAFAKTRDPRFLSRVFSPAECECIEEAADPEWALWLLWSAKESGFKIAQKISPTAVFAHKKFILSDETLGAMQRCSTSSLKGRLEFGINLYSIRWAWASSHIHCIATFEEDQDYSFSLRVENTLENSLVEMPLTLREQESIYSEESRRVRILAKRMWAEKNPSSTVELIRPSRNSRLGPPAFFEGEKPVPDIDLSLSHDGRFVAAVISFPS